ncbi:MAG: SDR family NAD(P)-dependent oxidoreductase [Desulfurococcaceae archaeon]
MESKQQVLVTGGAGFIGSHLVDKLVENNYMVIVIDNLSSGSIENIKHHLEKGSVKFVHGDLKNKDFILKAVENVETVFHLAANPEVRVSTTNPEVHFNENIVATFNLLEAMRLKDINTLVFASSSSVYGEPEKIPVSENAPIQPVSVYGASKAACENLIHAYSKLYGLNAIVLRYANIIGPRLRHGILYDLLIKLSKNRSVLEVLGDGTQTRSYLHVKDAVEATLLTWRTAKKGFNVYNVGNRDWITVKDIVDNLMEITGLKNTTKIVYKPILHGVGWPGDVKRIALDISKLIQLGWSPSMNSREAVVETIRSLINELNFTPNS